MVIDYSCDYQVHCVPTQIIELFELQKCNYLQLITITIYCDNSTATHLLAAKIDMNEWCDSLIWQQETAFPVSQT